MKNLLQTLAAVGLVATPFVGARADLILTQPTIVTVGGTGLGAVNTVLTIQAQGNNTTEAGCVSFNGATDQTGNALSSGECVGSNGDVKTGSSQTQTRSLSDAGITSGSNFAILFNADQPGGSGITLNSLTATFYSNAGTVLGSATFPGQTFAVTAKGTGNSGYEFTLNSTEASELQGFITAQGGAANVRVGLAAAASQAAGGNETFFIFNANTPVSATPEPASAALLATGLFGLVGIARRRRSS